MLLTSRITRSKVGYDCTLMPSRWPVELCVAAVPAGMLAAMTAAAAPSTAAARRPVRPVTPLIEDIPHPFPLMRTQDRAPRPVAGERTGADPYRRARAKYARRPRWPRRSASGAREAQGGRDRRDAAQHAYLIPRDPEGGAVDVELRHRRDARRLRRRERGGNGEGLGDLAYGQQPLDAHGTVRVLHGAQDVELDDREPLGGEEVVGAQVLVAGGVLRVDGVGAHVDHTGGGSVRVELAVPADALEGAFHGHQAPHRLVPEGDGGTRGVEYELAGGAGGHRSLLRK